jgi:hypothetical protein
MGWYVLRMCCNHAKTHPLRLVASVCSLTRNFVQGSSLRQVQPLHSLFPFALRPLYTFRNVRNDRSLSGSIWGWYRNLSTFSCREWWHIILSLVISQLFYSSASVSFALWNGCCMSAVWYWELWSNRFVITTIFIVSQQIYINVLVYWHNRSTHDKPSHRSYDYTLDFSHTSWTSLRPTQSSVQWITGLSRG